MKDYSFGNYICALRTGLGLSQFQLGTLVGVTDKAVSKWENGDAKPRLATCNRLAEVLGVSVNELLSCKKFMTLTARKETDKLNRKLWRQAYDRLSMYGDTPPVECWSRLVAEEAALQETDAIQGFAVLGRIAEQARLQNSTILVAGVLNSSYAAWLFGGTNVNPLKAHYYCPACGNVEFVPDVESGFDLPPKKCACGADYSRDGHNIPYEGYVQSVQFETTVDFRVSKEFKPIAVKTILDFYEGIAEILPVKIEDDDSDWCFEKYVVLPPEKKKPPVAADGYWHAGVEEYWNWHQDETSFSISHQDKLSELHKVQALTNTKWPSLSELTTKDMAIALYQRRKESAAFITDALSENECVDFDLLMRIDSLSHSTDAWCTNGELLVKNGDAQFREIPASREDIWTAIVKALNDRGIHEHGLALQVMEKGRKGVYSGRGMPDNIEKYLLSLDLPSWFPGYLKQVKYLFPKGHCVAFMIVDLIYEWYMMNLPDEMMKVKDTK